MTVIKVTVGRWIWWFWLANQSSVKRTTAQIQQPPDTSWLMPVPDKKGPLTVLLLNWVKWQKMLLSPTPALPLCLSFKPYILLYFLALFFLSVLFTLLRQSVLLTVIIELVGEMLISKAYLCLRLYACSCVHWMSHTVFEYSTHAQIDRSIGGQNTLVSASAGTCVTNSC